MGQLRHARAGRMVGVTTATWRHKSFLGLFPQWRPGSGAGDPDHFGLDGTDIADGGDPWLSSRMAPKADPGLGLLAVHDGGMRDKVRCMRRDALI